MATQRLSSSISRVAASGVCLAAVIATLSSCASSQPVPSASGGLSIAKYIEMAEQAGADDRQIEVLERANERGEVTFEDLNELAQLTIQCEKDAGFTVIEKTPVEYVPDSGLFTPSFLSIQPDGMSDKVAGEVMDSCSDRYDTWAGAAFADQPIVVEAYNSQWDTPEVRACLKERGYQVDDDMTGTELNNLSMEDWTAHASAPGFRGCDPDIG